MTTHDDHDYDHDHDHGDHAPIVHDQPPGEWELLESAVRELAIADGEAAWQLGATNYDHTHLIVLENTPEVHNVVVCTLCPCYPRPLLGSRQIGTRARRIAAASCVGHAACSPNSAR